MILLLGSVSSVRTAYHIGKTVKKQGSAILSATGHTSMPPNVHADVALSAIGSVKKQRAFSVVKSKIFEHGQKMIRTSRQTQKTFRHSFDDGF